MRIRRQRSHVNQHLGGASFAYNLLRSDGCDNIKNARWRAVIDIDALFIGHWIPLRTKQLWVSRARRYLNAGIEVVGIL